MNFHLSLYECRLNLVYMKLKTELWISILQNFEQSKYIAAIFFSFLFLIILHVLVELPVESLPNRDFLTNIC